MIFANIGGWFALYEKTRREDPLTRDRRGRVDVGLISGIMA